MTNPVDVKTGLTCGFLHQLSGLSGEELKRYTSHHIDHNLYYLFRLNLPVIVPLKQKLKTLR